MSRYLAYGNGVLVVLYLGLIATAMAYAALEVEFSDSIKNDEASVAVLESNYLNKIATITTTDTASLGYTTPVAVVYVPGAPQTAFNDR